MKSMSAEEFADLLRGENNLLLSREKPVLVFLTIGKCDMCKVLVDNWENKFLPSLYNKFHVFSYIFCDTEENNHTIMVHDNPQFESLNINCTPALVLLWINRQDYLLGDGTFKTKEELKARVVTNLHSFSYIKNTLIDFNEALPSLIPKDGDVSLVSLLKVSFFTNYQNDDKPNTSPFVGVLKGRSVNSENIILPEDPSHTDYYFRGWYAELNCINEFDFSTIISHDTTLYAKWEAKPTFQVILDSNGGDKEAVPSVLDVIEDKTIIISNIPEKEDFDFKGWYTEPECTTQFDLNTPITQSITLYAKWEAKKESFISLLLLIINTTFKEKIPRDKFTEVLDYYFNNDSTKFENNILTFCNQIVEYANVE